MNHDDTPVRREFLPPFAPSLGEEEYAEVLDTLRSGWITMGPKTRTFESAFAQYASCQHALAVSSCTAGLHLSYGAGFLLGLGRFLVQRVTRTPSEASDA